MLEALVHKGHTFDDEWKYMQLMVQFYKVTTTYWLSSNKYNMDKENSKFK